MTTQDMLDQRYGRASSSRRRWTIGIIAGVGALVAILFAWMTFASALDDVGVDTTGFTVEDARTVALAFQITAPEGRTVACVLEAQDEEHGIVGWKVLEFPASELHARAFRESIPTTAEATTGLVGDCWVT